MGQEAAAEQTQPVMALVLPPPVHQMLQPPEVAVAAEVLLAEVVVPVVAAVLVLMEVMQVQVALEVQVVMEQQLLYQVLQQHTQAVAAAEGGEYLLRFILRSAMMREVVDVARRRCRCCSPWLAGCAWPLSCIFAAKWLYCCQVDGRGMGSCCQVACNDQAAA